MHIRTSEQEVFKIGLGEYTCNWGMHMCGLYENEEERDRIIFGFFKQGLNDGDLNLYCPVERSESDFKQKFAFYYPEYSSKLNDPDHFVFITPRDLYYPDGSFSPWAMEKTLNSFFVASQKKGRRNIRASAEMIWALEAIRGVEDLMVYESRLNYFTSGKPWGCICLYNVNKFPEKTIMNVLRTHPFTVNKGIITQNPYYVDPDIWMGENTPDFLNI